MPLNPFNPVTPTQFQGWASFFGGNVQQPAPPPPSAWGANALGQPPSNGQYTGGWAYPDSWANFYEGKQGFVAPQNQNSPAGALAAENYATNINNPNDPNLLGWEQAYGNPQTILKQDQNWAQSLGPAPTGTPSGQLSGGWQNPEAWAAYYGGTNGFTAPANAGSPASALAAAATISQTNNPQDNPALRGWVQDYGQPGSILANTPNWAASLGTPQTNAMGQDIGQTNTQGWESPLAWAAFYGGQQGYKQPVDNTLQAAQNWEGVTNQNDPSLLGWELDYGNPQTVVSTIEASPAYQQFIAAQKAQAAQQAAQAAQAAQQAAQAAQAAQQAAAAAPAMFSSAWLAQNPGAVVAYTGTPDIAGPLQAYAAGRLASPPAGAIPITWAQLQQNYNAQGPNWGAPYGGEFAAVHGFDPNAAIAGFHVAPPIGGGGGGGGGGGVTPILNGSVGGGAFGTEGAGFALPQPAYQPVTSPFVLMGGAYTGYVPGAFADTAISPLSNDITGFSISELGVGPGIDLGGPVGPIGNGFYVPTTGIGPALINASGLDLGLPSDLTINPPAVGTPLTNDQGQALAGVNPLTVGGLGPNATYNGGLQAAEAIPFIDLNPSTIVAAGEGLVPQFSAVPYTPPINPDIGSPISGGVDFNPNVDDLGRPVDNTVNQAPTFDLSQFAQNLGDYLSSIGAGWAPDNNFISPDQIPDITLPLNQTAPGVAVTPHVSQPQQQQQPVQQNAPEISGSGLSDLALTTNPADQANQSQAAQALTNTGAQQAPTNNLALQSGLQGNIDQSQGFPSTEQIPVAAAAPQIDIGQSVPFLDTSAVPGEPDLSSAYFAYTPPIDWLNTGFDTGLNVSPYSAQNANEQLVQSLNGNFTFGNLAQVLGVDAGALQQAGIDPNTSIDPTQPLQPQIDAVIAKLPWLIQSAASGMISAGLAAKGLSISGIQSALQNPNIQFGQLSLSGRGPANLTPQLPTPPSWEADHPVPPGEIPNIGEAWPGSGGGEDWNVTPPGAQIGETGAGPFHMGGSVSFDGLDASFPFFSGGAGQGSLPYGTFNIDLTTGVGPMGQTGFGGKVPPAIAGLTTNSSGNVISGPYYTGNGIEIHAWPDSASNAGVTLGCFGIPLSQWGQFSQQLQTYAAQNGGSLTLTIQPNPNGGTLNAIATIQPTNGGSGINPNVTVDQVAASFAASTGGGAGPEAPVIPQGGFGGGFQEAPPVIPQGAFGGGSPTQTAPFTPTAPPEFSIPGTGQFQPEFQGENPSGPLVQPQGYSFPSGTFGEVPFPDLLPQVPSIQAGYSYLPGTFGTGEGFNFAAPELRALESPPTTSLGGPIPESGQAELGTIQGPAPQFDQLTEEPLNFVGNFPNQYGATPPEPSSSLEFGGPPNTDFSTLSALSSFPSLSSKFAGPPEIPQAQPDVLYGYPTGMTVPGLPESTFAQTPFNAAPPADVTAANLESYPYESDFGPFTGRNFIELQHGMYPIGQNQVFSGQPEYNTVYAPHNTTYFGDVGSYQDPGNPGVFNLGINPGAGAGTVNPGNIGGYNTNFGGISLPWNGQFGNIALVQAPNGEWQYLPIVDIGPNQTARSQGELDILTASIPGFGYTRQTMPGAGWQFQVINPQGPFGGPPSHWR